MKEKELTINGTKYIRVDENKNYKVGDIVKFNNYEWYIIKLIDNKATLLMKDCLPENKMQEIFDSEYLADDNDVVFNLDQSNSDWKDSIIRKKLNDTFIDEFNKNELNVMKTNYDEDKYSEDYIRLVTIREIERTEEKIRKSSKSNWTMSPSSFDASYAYAFVWRVNSTGYLTAAWSPISYGVRPVINVNVEYLESDE